MQHERCLKVENIFGYNQIFIKHNSKSDLLLSWGKASFGKGGRMERQSVRLLWPT